MNGEGPFSAANLIVFTGFLNAELFVSQAPVVHSVAPLAHGHRRKPRADHALVVQVAKVERSLLPAVPPSIDTMTTS